MVDTNTTQLLKRLYEVGGEGGGDFDLMDEALEPLL